MPGTSAHWASARPRKRFFLEMFTRDITLEDCILDLIDNSIDSLVRTQNLDLLKLSDVSPGVSQARKPPFHIDLTVGPEKFSIVDNCGGIPLHEAVEETFNFGKSDENPGEARLGAYGIGLKRAIFKIGSMFEMESQTTVDGFKVKQNVQEWAQKDDTLEDWRFPLTPTRGARKGRTGTRISISRLREEVRMRIKDGNFEAQLRNQISRVYLLFLDKFVRITVNEVSVPPFPLALAASDVFTPAVEKYDDGDVAVGLFASLAARDKRGEWHADTAGWYVICNGRAVLVANKDDVTGWGGGALPTFQPKYRGFIGLALFFSNNPLLLPWTTTKRALNRESIVFQKARNRMRGLARPVLTFLDGMYSSEPVEDADQRGLTRSLQVEDIGTLERRPPGSFSVKRPTRRERKSTVRVQFDAEKSDIDLVRKHLRSPNMGANQVGSYTLDYYLKMEGLK